MKQPDTEEFKENSSVSMNLTKNSSGQRTSKKKSSVKRDLTKSLNKCDKHDGYCLPRIHGQKPDCNNCLKVEKMLKELPKYMNIYGTQLGLKMYERSQNHAM